MLTNSRQIFPLFEPAAHFHDVKDPCPVFNGREWHLFGSGGSTISESWLIYHATAPALEGPWTEQPAINLGLSGSGVAAPGVLFSDGLFRMFIQTEFMKEGGTVEYLTSNDGFVWEHVGAALHSIPGTSEHGIYDPHPAVVGGTCYIVYSGMPAGWPPKPDIYLAKSVTGTWEGPWLRLGRILDHQSIAEHHNQHDDDDYEWGIEGAQLVELPDGRVLLNATSFLPTGARGSRQRVFFALAEDVTGPYRTCGPVLEPSSVGENGHSTALLEGNDLILCYQTRLESTGRRWRYGLASVSTDRIALPVDFRSDTEGDPPTRDAVSGDGSAPMLHSGS
jgi:hypothetical protein